MKISVFEEKVDVNIEFTPEELMLFLSKGNTQVIGNGIAKGVFAAISNKLKDAKIVAAPVPAPKMEVHKNRKRHRRRH